MVEHDLAKVGVASSSLVSRSRSSEAPVRRGFVFSACESATAARATRPRTGSPLDPGADIAPSPAWWQSGHAAACKAVYAGSIPTQASILFRKIGLLPDFRENGPGRAGPRFPASFAALRRRRHIPVPHRSVAARLQPFSLREKVARSSGREYADARASRDGSPARLRAAKAASRRISSVAPRQLRRTLTQPLSRRERG